MGVKEVMAGAEWLDREFPGWEREIDLGTLDLSNCQTCICGQSLHKLVGGLITSGYAAAGAIITGADDVFSRCATTDQFVAWAGAHGFAVSERKEYEEAQIEFRELEGLWAELIKERFSTGNLSDEC